MSEKIGFSPYHPTEVRRMQMWLLFLQSFYTNCENSCLKLSRDRIPDLVE